MTDLRKEARGRECQVRLTGVCNFSPATTVLAHVRLAGLTGIGQKSNDLHAAWCCSSCHDVVDGRVRHDLGREYVQIAMYEGVLRTQNQLIKEGKIKF